MTDWHEHGKDDDVLVEDVRVDAPAVTGTPSVRDLFRWKLRYATPGTPLVLTEQHLQHLGAAYVTEYLREHGYPYDVISVPRPRVEPWLVRYRDRLADQLLALSDFVRGVRRDD